MCEVWTGHPGMSVARAGEGPHLETQVPLAPGPVLQSLFLKARLLRCLDLRQVGIHSESGAVQHCPWAACLPAPGLASGPLAAVGWQGCPAYFRQPALSLCIYRFSLNVPITSASGSALRQK